MIKKNKHTRRTVIKNAALGIGALSFSTGFPSILKADDNIKIGIPTILSGRVAQLGISVTNAIKMAVNKLSLL